MMSNQGEPFKKKLFEMRHLRLHFAFKPMNLNDLKKMAYTLYR